MEKLHTYNLKLVTFVLGLTDFSAYGAEGGLKFEPLGERAIPTVSATGQAVVSITNNFAGTCTVTVGEWTREYRDLAALMQAQEEEVESGPITELDLLMYDPINGDRISDPWVAFLNHPTPDKVLEAGEREFMLFLPNCFRRSNSSFGANIT